MWPTSGSDAIDLIQLIAALIDSALAGGPFPLPSSDLGAEVHPLDHRALVDVADLRVRRDRLDPVDRGLDRLRIGGGHLHRAVVLDIDLGAGLLDDLADHLAAGAAPF